MEIATGEAITVSVLGIAALATLIQIAPIKINPWTALARAIGRAINSEVLSEVNTMKAQVSSIEEELAEQRAIGCRVRILRFGDELLHDVRHTKEHFDQTLTDITFYENYCDTHPDFENDMTVITTQHIKAVYSECLKSHSFL